MLHHVSVHKLISPPRRLGRDAGLTPVEMSYQKEDQSVGAVAGRVM
jgi:hypothetical protein